MHFMNSTELKTLYTALAASLSERGRRQFAGAAVKASGRRHISFVARSLGMSRNTVMASLKEMGTGGTDWPASRIRKRGGGRKQLTATHTNLLQDLESLVEPTLRGDPMSPLRWTCKSTANLSRELKKKGYAISSRTVAGLLKELKYSLQGNRKSHEGKKHPDRNAQFHYINESVRSFHEEGCPVISVDAKKKELIGDFKNAGKQWRPRGTPECVNVYDFLSLADGRATPYGAFDLFRNEGWVSVGIDHDTSSFAVDSIFQWWKQMGCRAYPQANKLLITADGGGSNSHRSRLWKKELQRLANEIGMEIHVRHFPPGTSKWNKIEHRMFSFISMNWRGEPLRSFSAVVNLIGATTNRQGLKIECALNTKTYPTGTKVPDQDMKTIAIKPDIYHGDWNYSISPNV
jgi:transposase